MRMADAIMAARAGKSHAVARLATLASTVTRQWTIVPPICAPTTPPAFQLTRRTRVDVLLATLANIVISNSIRV